MVRSPKVLHPSALRNEPTAQNSQKLSWSPSLVVRFLGGDGVILLHAVSTWRTVQHLASIDKRDVIKKQKNEE